MNHQLKSLLLLIAVAVIFLAGCKKNSASQNPASVVGTWTLSSETITTAVNNKVVQDTSFAVPVSEQFIITFGSNGFYTEVNPGSQFVGSAYTYSGNVLSLFDTSMSRYIWDRYTVTNLTEHQLQFIISSDSSHTLPDTILQLQFLLTR